MKYRALREHILDRVRATVDLRPDPAQDLKLELFAEMSHAFIKGKEGYEGDVLLKAPVVACLWHCSMPPNQVSST